MLEKISALTLSVIRHSDRHNVVTLFTRTRGRVSFLSPASRSSRRSNGAALLQPLSWIDAEVNFKAEKELQSLSKISLHTPWRSLYFDPVKSAVVMFLSEFLNKLLRTSAPDPAIFDYIAGFLGEFDAMREGVANAHIAFLTGLLVHAGIYPLLDWKKTGNGPCWFDMQAATLVTAPPSHHDVLNPEEVRYLRLLTRLPAPAVRRLRLSGAARSRIITTILRYYTIHLPGTAGLKSLPVLHDLFS